MGRVERSTSTGPRETEVSGCAVSRIVWPGYFTKPSAVQGVVRTFLHRGGGPVSVWASECRGWLSEIVNFPSGRACEDGRWG